MSKSKGSFPNVLWRVPGSKTRCLDRAVLPCLLSCILLPGLKYQLKPLFVFTCF